MRKHRTTDWVLAGIGVVVLAVILLWTTGRFSVSSPRPVLTRIAQTPSPGLFELSPSPAATLSGPGETEVLALFTPTPQPTPVIILPELPDVTPPPDGQVHNVVPAFDAVGWAREGDQQANHFGDYNIYAGVFDGQRHIGAIQFDLAQVPPGAPIVYADLTLVGLSEQWLADEGTWTVRILEWWMDSDWSEKSLADLARGDGAFLDLDPTLTAGDLKAGRANVFALGPQALRALEARVFTGRISFRIDGPASDGDNLFSWDSGFGARSLGWAPVLRIVAGPAPERPPATPTPQYVIITSTPGPANVVTQAAIAATATIEATTTGTPTPLPPNWVTPVVIIPTETPANAATAQWHAAVATAQVSLYGTPTPLPVNAWTATPTPVLVVVASGFVVVTSTPTPENVLTAAAIAVQETAWATTTGTATAAPQFITATPRYIVVTNTPTPANYATALYQRAVATAYTILTGTPTPTPHNLATATYTPRPTQTPVLFWLDETTSTPTPEVSPVPSPSPTAPLPAILRGKIAFLSDRSGGEQPSVYILDPDSGRVGLLTDRWPYDLALVQDRHSPDGEYVVDVRGGQGGVRIFVTQLSSGVSWAVTFGKALDYDPVWSPKGDLIAYVSQEMGPEGGGDDIFTVTPQGKDKRRLTFNTWEWDKRPSFSPDGSQIVFWSNQITGRKQLWIMNWDGTNRHILLASPYNDWDPVWIK